MTAESQSPPPDLKRDRIVFTCAGNLSAITQPYEVIAIRRTGETGIEFVPRVDQLPEDEFPRSNSVPFHFSVTVGTPEQILADFCEKFTKAAEALFDTSARSLMWGLIAQMQEHLAKHYPDMPADKVMEMPVYSDQDEQYQAFLRRREEMITANEPS